MMAKKFIHEGKEVSVDDVEIVDLWHIAMLMGDATIVSSYGEELSSETKKRMSRKILDTWNLAHSLLRALKPEEEPDKCDNIVTAIEHDLCAIMGEKTRAEEHLNNIDQRVNNIRTMLKELQDGPN